MIYIPFVDVVENEIYDPKHAIKGRPLSFFPLCVTYCAQLIKEVFLIKVFLDGDTKNVKFTSTIKHPRTVPIN
jgi:hypothetical protein